MSKRFGLDVVLERHEVARCVGAGDMRSLACSQDESVERYAPYQLVLLVPNPARVAERLACMIRDMRSRH